MASAYSSASEGFSSRLLRTWRRRYQRSPSLDGDKAQRWGLDGQGAVAGSSSPIPVHILPIPGWKYPRGYSTCHGHALLHDGDTQLAGVGIMQTATWALHQRKGQQMCAAPESTARAGLTR